jgi:hypothetical protein
MASELSNWQQITFLFMIGCGIYAEFKHKHYSAIYFFLLVISLRICL